MSLYKKTSSSSRRCSNNLYSILITQISFTTLTCQSYIGTKLSFWFPLYSTKIGMAYMWANITAIQSNQWLKMLGCFVYMMVFSATFNNISVISLGSGLLKMCLGDRYNLVVVFWANFCNRCLSSLVAISTAFFQIHETRTNRDNSLSISFYLYIL